MQHLMDQALSLALKCCNSFKNCLGTNTVVTLFCPNASEKDNNNFMTLTPGVNDINVFTASLAVGKISQGVCFYHFFQLVVIKVRDT